MPGIAKKSFSSPDESRTPEKTNVAVVDLGSTKAAKLTMEPGWKWSDCIKPVVGTDSCQARHVGTVVSGRLSVAHEDGTQIELAPGDAYVIEPGHDAWVEGNEAWVAYEFEAKSAETYAKG
jgi:mannose-6-phosphate isomerase-like protein (cupin superfamily)